MPSTFANATERPGWLRVRGEESLASLNRTSLLTRKLTSVYATVTTKMEFEPEVYQHSAGLTIYYDNMNNIFLRKYYSQTLGGSAISIVRLENGEKTEMLDTRVAVEDKPIYFRLNIEAVALGSNGVMMARIGPRSVRISIPPRSLMNTASSVSSPALWSVLPSLMLRCMRRPPILISSIMRRTKRSLSTDPARAATTIIQRP